MRTLLLWCPDWPVVAAGIADGVDIHRPVAVLYANRVLACSPAARLEGVHRGLRKREAQARCPKLVVLAYDPSKDAAAYEPVVAAVEESAPGVEVLRPGVCAVAARGPASYYGGEEAAAEHLVEQVALRCEVEVQVGIADGVFAAMLAARAGQIVPPGGTPAFLSRMDISALGRPDLVDLLRRLGIRTLGEFAALPEADILARFGFDAAYAHRQAAGNDERPLAVRKPPPDLTVSAEYDPPLDRVDRAAFAAKALAEQLQQRLAGHGLAATRLGIEARTAAGEELHRVWRHDGHLDTAAISDRVRWQLDGWLTGSARPDRPTAGIDRLRLVPDGIVRYAGMQLGLWGELGAADARAHRALTRVQGLLGPHSTYTAVLGGGRGYAERVQLVAWGDERPGPLKDPAPPWPGRLPAPAPATVLAEPTPLELTAADGTPVTIDERMKISSPPALARPRGEPAVAVTGWAGPWPVQQRWWAPAEAVHLVRLQLRLADGRALLVARRDGRWSIEASYD